MFKFYICIRYKCHDCGYEEWAPAFVVDEFADMDDYLGENNIGGRRNGMPVMVCPNYDADFTILEKKKSNILLRFPERGFFYYAINNTDYSIYSFLFINVISINYFEQYNQNYQFY